MEIDVFNQNINARCNNLKVVILPNFLLTGCSGMCGQFLKSDYYAI